MKFSYETASFGQTEESKKLLVSNQSCVLIVDKLQYSKNS